MNVPEMAGLVMESVFVVVTLVFSARLAVKEPEESRKAYAISFVFMAALAIGFSAGQIAAAFHIVDVVLRYTPVEILSIMSMSYWFGFYFRKTSFFERITG